MGVAAALLVTIMLIGRLTSCVPSGPVCTGHFAGVQSPLWHSTGSQGQDVTYGYTGSQLVTTTWGAGTTDAVTATFGYSGTLLTTVTPPAGLAWTLGYDGAGRLTSISSPASGTPGQEFAT